MSKLDLDLTKRIEELENSLSIALDINDKYQRENVALKKRSQEAEGELSIIKGIGNNSPEMKAYELENKRLKGDLERLAEENTNYEIISKSHKKLNGELHQVIKEVKEDNKKLAKQIEDMQQNYIRIDGKK